MEDGTANLLDALATAIKSERDSHSFYQMATHCSKDPKAKEIFARLATEELNHMQFLMRQRESVLKTGKPDSSAKLGPRVDLSGLFPIFSDGIRARIKDAHFEMSALSIGVQLELDGVKFYRSQAESADDPATKKFYTELAEWEAGHYEVLLRQQEDLKEEYWTASGLSPA